MTIAATDSVVPERPYPNAPIIEAVIDLHIEYPAADAIETLRKFAETISPSFPRMEPLHEIRVQIDGELDGQASKTTHAQQTGWRLFNADGDRILVLQRVAFTYSHSAPYTRWEIFGAECEQLWRRFVDLCKPIRVTRLAARNINLLKLPAGQIDLTDYLNIGPELPDSLGVVSGVVLQVQIPQPSVSLRGHSTVTLASQQSNATDHQPMILDIDMFEEGDWSPADPVMWQQLERLRHRKNDIFEACVTDKTRRLFA